MQPFPYHRVQTAVKLFLFISLAGSRTKGEVLNARFAVSVYGACDFHNDAPNRSTKRGVVEDGPEFLLGRARIAQGTRMPQVKIDYDIVVSRHTGDQRRKRAHCFCESRKFGLVGENMNALSPMIIFSG